MSVIAPRYLRLNKRLRLNRYSFYGWVLRISVLLIVGVVLLPIVYLGVRSAELQSLSSVAKLSTYHAILRTIGLAFSVCLLSTIIALPTAWLTTRTDLYFSRFWQTATALPLVLPSYIAAYLFVSTLGPKGLIQQWLGIDRFPNLYGFWGALLVLSFLSYPYILLSVRAQLQRMDDSLLEAARSLGRTPRQTFWQITLPYLRPSLVAGNLLVALYVLRDFGAVSMLRYGTLTRIIFIQYNSLSDRAISAILGLILAFLTILLLFADIQTRGQAIYRRVAVGASRKRAKQALTRWEQITAQLFLSIILTFSLLMPICGLIYWTLRGWSQANFSGIWQAAASSITVSLATALTAALCAIPVALLATRNKGKTARWLTQLTYLGFALPGIVIALALTFFAIRTPLYGTQSILILAYIILFLPQAIGAIRASLIQIAPSLEEAGRSLGYNASTVLRHITLPLVTPGIRFGAALVFLTCMKELPATLILSPFGFKTLATMVWSNISEAFFAQAAVPSLLLILLSSIPLAWLNHRS